MFRFLISTKPINSICLRCYSINQLPRITLPKTLSEDGGLELLEKKYRHRQNKLHRGELFVHGNKKIPIITSKYRPQLNQFYNQRYKRGSQITLASDGWLRGMKYDGDVIKFMPFESNKVYKKETQKPIDLDIVSFESLGIREQLCRNLVKSFGAKIPNEVQVKTIPKVLSGMNVRCCFETGTGKTLAYALPLVENVLREKESEKQANPSVDDTKLKEPKIMIIVPSRELGYQTSEVFSKLTAGLNIGVATILGGKPLHLTHSGYDIVITTLGMFQSNLSKAQAMYSINKIKHLVIDEIDTMCDSSFNKEVGNLLNNFSFVNPDNQNACQLILVSATFPQYVYDVISDFIDLKNISVSTSKKVNHLLFHMTHIFYRINRLDRPEKLLDLCATFEKDPGQTIIFVNRTPAAKFIEHFLSKNDFDCVSFIKQPGNAEKRFHNFLDFQNNRVKFLVSTDLGSRGLDTRNVQHIINFDCPRFEADYVHRAGRTGRMNSPNAFCSVNTFVSFKPDVYMLQNLERSVREDKPIEGINLDIKNFYQKKYGNINLERNEDDEDD